MIKIGIAGFGKIGQLRAQKISEKNYAQVVAIYDVKEPLNFGRDMVFCHTLSLVFAGLIAILGCLLPIKNIANLSPAGVLYGR